MIGDPQPPFEKWILPQIAWRSPHCTAYNALGAEQTVSGATIVVANEQSSPAAVTAWTERARAATLLQAAAPKPRRGLLARVIESGVPEFPCYVILQRPYADAPTLEERVRVGTLPNLRQCVEIGIALCDILKTASDSGVEIVDVPLAAIAFEDAPGLRVVQLLDPCAVVPPAQFFPEWRELSEGELEPLDFVSAHRAQVFLVCSIVLGLARGTTDALSDPFRPRGRAASLAVLAGEHGLADAQVDRVVAPLVEHLRRRGGSSASLIDVVKLVETLRWALSESPADRHQSVRELSVALEGSLVR